MLNKTLISKTTASYRSKLIIQSFTDWVRKDQTVIDIGCGTGAVTQSLKEAFSVKVTGCDIKNYLIDKSIPFVKIKQNFSLPFKKNQYDLGLLIDVLHHLDFNQQEKLISESLRSSKALLIFEAKPTLTGKIADIVLNKYHYGDLNLPLTFRHKKDWEKLFKKLGANYESKNLKIPFWYPFKHIAFKVTKGRI